MIADLVKRVFATRNAAHIEHWKTKSYAQHMALGAFYDAIIDSVDAIVEAHQGVFELVDVGAIDKQAPVKDIIKLMEDDLVWINKNRKQITNGLAAIDNLLQGLEGDYMSALYKLKRLS